MSIRIEIFNGSELLRVEQFQSGEYVIGNGVDAQIKLQYPTVSRHHAKLVLTADNTITVSDLGSKNGTYRRTKFTDSPLLIGEDLKIELSDAIEVGPFKLLFSLLPLDTVCDEEMLFSKAANRYSELLGENPNAASQDLHATLVKYEAPLKKNIHERVLAEFHGHGPLDRYLRLNECREVLVNSYNEIFVDLGLGLYRAPESFLNSATFEAWAARTARACGRRLDLQHPICEATLSDGARFHAVLPPLSHRGLSVAIRKFGSAPLTETQALSSGWLDPHSLELLKEAIANRHNIVISGGTSTGKTSLLGFLCRYLDPSERVITVEDTAELAPPIANLVQLQSRIANSDGIGAVSLRELVQCALRMRPDRIIVGECRGPEVLDMLQALNTGHPGSLTTIHANSPDEALHRMELLALLGAPNLSIECIRSWIKSTVHLVIQVERDERGIRKLTKVLSRQTAGEFQTIYERK
jgi:pilus assembly protein CpaF